MKRRQPNEVFVSRIVVETAMRTGEHHRYRVVEGIPRNVKMTGASYDAEGDMLVLTFDGKVTEPLLQRLHEVKEIDGNQG